MESLTLKKVETLRQALTLRKIRNECRSFMTIDKSNITLIQQLKWFYNDYVPKLNSGDTIVYLLELNGVGIGYGLIRGKKIHPVISGGILEKYRGKKFGRYLFEALTKEASVVDGRIGDRSVFLEVLENNERALCLYKKLGFVEKTRGNGVISMQKDYGEFDR